MLRRGLSPAAPAQQPSHSIAASSYHFNPCQGAVVIQLQQLQVQKKKDGIPLFYVNREVILNQTSAKGASLKVFQNETFARTAILENHKLNNKQ